MNHFLIFPLSFFFCISLYAVNNDLSGIPHTRDSSQNLWIRIQDLGEHPNQTFPVVLRYLSTKQKLEGCYIEVPYSQVKHIDYLKSQGFQPYRLSAEETVWVLYNGRGIPDQSNTLADGRVALFNKDGKLLFIRGRESKWWVLPGGGIEKDEFIKVGAARELKEEVGVDFGTEHLRLVAAVNIKGNISKLPTNIIQHYYVSTKSYSSEIRIQASEVDDYAWLDIKAISPTFQHKGFFLSPKTFDLLPQFRSETSQTDSRFDPKLAMIVETFKW